MYMVIRHNCGIVVAHTLHDVYSMLSSLQHRGREAAGIAAIGSTIDVIKWKGSVKTFDLHDLHKILDGSKYHTFLAHVRYATKGNDDCILEEAHPHVIGGREEHRGNHIFVFDCDGVIVHNGQVNFKDSNIQSDTKSLLDLYWRTGEEEVLRSVPGAFTLAIADRRKKDVIVLRDQYGMRPGVLGWKDGKYVVTSEDIALRKNGAILIEDLKPGCVYYLKPNGSYETKEIISHSFFSNCFFEYNYISSAESVINGVSVQKIRRFLGEQLALEHTPDDIDFVSYLPRCPEDAARGYADIRGLPFKPVFYKQKAERAFQGTTSAQRASSIKSNLYVLPSMQKDSSFLKGKVIYLIDDSTIRGNNAKHAISLLKSVGVKKIYLVNYTPKIGIIGKDGIGRGCEYGVDMPPSDPFIVRDNDRNKADVLIDEELGASVYFMSIDGMFEAFKRAGLAKKDMCYYCIGGKRPF